MPNAKFPTCNKGFTLIELMVVVAIMGMLATVVVISLAGQRAGRDIKIAQNQLVSNIRQAQGYILSSRTLPSGQAVQFYVLKFDMATPTQYTLEAIYNVSAGPQLTDIQTISLPSDIRIATITPATYPIAIDRSPASDAVDQYASSPYLQTPTCALMAFSAPFGKIIFNGSCNRNNWNQNSDDYENIVNFQVNTPCSSSGIPQVCSVSTDALMTITLSDVGKTVSKTVTVNAITGSVTFN